MYINVFVCCNTLIDINVYVYIYVYVCVSDLIYVPLKPHLDIRLFPSECFYQGLLVDSECVKQVILGF